MDPSPSTRASALPEMDPKDRYPPCSYCGFQKPSQDMELHINVCEARQGEVGFLNAADVRKFLSSRSPHHYHRRRQCGAPPNNQAYSTTPRGEEADEDSATLVEEVAARRVDMQTGIRPDLGDRFPLVEPCTPEIRAVDETATVSHSQRCVSPYALEVVNPLVDVSTGSDGSSEDSEDDRSQPLDIAYDRPRRM